MGMLKYALAGGIAGGANTYLDMEKERRKTEAEVKADERQATMQEKRDARLAEYNIEAAKVRSDFDAAEGDKTRQTQIDINQSRIDADKDKPLIVGSGSDAVSQTETDPDTGKAKVIYQNDDKTTGLDTDALNKIDKDFRIAAGSLYRVDDLSSMDDKTRNNVTRLASISSKLIRKYPNIDPNTILLKSYEQVTKNPSKDIDGIIGELEKLDDMWWLTDDEKKLKFQLEQEQAAAEKNQYSNELPGLGGNGKGGMLSEDLGPTPSPHEESKGPVKISNRAEYAKLKPGTRYVDPSGIERTKK